MNQSIRPCATGERRTARAWGARGGAINDARPTKMDQTPGVIFNGPAKVDGGRDRTGRT